MNKIISQLQIRRVFPILCCVLAVAISFPVSAVDSYTFEAVSPDELYIPDTAPVGLIDNGELIIDNSGYHNTAADEYPDVFKESAVQRGQSFASASDIRNADGSTGTLEIPAIGLSVTVYAGDLDSAMKNGAGYLESAGVWDGNIGIIGHNRGVNENFGKLKNLKCGDEIRYSTDFGTRIYVVAAVERISSTDWSYLEATADNRITLITCVEDQPRYRLCVQAVEKR